MPTFDLNISFYQLKTKLKQYLWEHFKSNFDISNNCTLHHSCPCSKLNVTHQGHLYQTLTASNLANHVATLYQ